MIHSPRTVALGGGDGATSNSADLTGALVMFGLVGLLVAVPMLVEVLESCNANIEQRVYEERISQHGYQQERARELQQRQSQPDIWRDWINGR